MTDGLDEAAQTAAEHAAATAAEPGRRAKARASRPAVLQPDAPEGACANCETELQGPVCYNCGQVNDEFHRPVRGLAFELVEGLLSLDGRVARTLPNLLGRPGRITRDYLKGRRARYMPPFRLYIIASLIFFLVVPSFEDLATSWNDSASEVAETVSGAGEGAAALRTRVEAEIGAAIESGEMTPEEAEAALEVMRGMGLAPRQGPGPVDGVEPAAGDAARDPGMTEDTQTPTGDAGLTLQRGDRASETLVIGPGGDPDQIRRFFAPEDFGEAPLDTVFPLQMRRFIGDRFARTASDPGGWVSAVQAWIPRLMFVMVPLYAFLLALTYAWRRGFFFYDHLIVSLHFHSALFLAMSVLMLIGGPLAFGLLLLYSNAYLYRLHRVVYGRGRFSSVLRTLTLDFFYFIALLMGFVAASLLGVLAG